MIDACEKFGCLPEELYRADSELIRLLRIVEMGTPEEADGAGSEYDDYEEYEEV